jgi:hypothetical protein
MRTEQGIILLLFNMLHAAGARPHIRTYGKAVSVQTDSVVTESGKLVLSVSSFLFILLRET